MDIENQAPAESKGGLPPNPNRRRFASTGVKASGLILTLVSAPGMADTMCRAPSGSLSGNLQSSHGNQVILCNGLSPGYWKFPDKHPWPAGCYPTATDGQAATTFASVFPYGSTDLYRTGTMLAVLNSNDPAQDPYNLGFHLVAAYLNVMSGKISFFTVTTLTNMWHDFNTYGYYTPAAGHKWGAYEIAQYLQSTEN